ncbi:MAG: NAD+ synthase [Deltaproteobacteria bacterium]|jgi:NAD+ synthetase|nr:NAD+ synthase [Deltaproteobacteria bacterium]
MKIALIQLNPRVGAARDNLKKMTAAIDEAKSLGAKVCVFPEMAVTGYPPRDLLLYGAFVREAEECAEKLREVSGRTGLLILAGSVGRNLDGKGHHLRNLATVFDGGKVLGVYAKRLLPTYDVFDEARYFEAGEEPLVFEKEGRRFAVTICEDIWNDEAYWPRPLYKIDPLENHPPFDVLVNVSASPFSVGKQKQREDMLRTLARKRGALVLYANQVGANDELIFDGRSSVTGPDGTLLARAKAFGEDILVFDLDGQPEKNVAPDDFSPESETWRALGLGVRDYCEKNGISKAVLGLSGGVDSALTAAAAAEALGPENVRGLVMPSPHSSDHSVRDALELARNLGLAPPDVIPIGPAMRAFSEALAPAFGNLPPDATEENVQARIRGVLLMAMANKFGAMLLTTGNKSEISVGYCTIYGDMCGALAVIGDLYKTEVYALAKWLNKDKIVIPESTLAKPPSAELRPGQIDEDSLPPYERLDAMLGELLEKRKTPGELALSGAFDPAEIARVGNLVRRGEFKRRQAAPVLKITAQAFGVGWRMPVACRSPFGGDDRG